MTKDNLPVPAGGYGPALTKLADTVRHVVDLVAGPDRIRAKAQAEADAEVIRAGGRAQVQDLEARAIERIRRREVRRQQNIEAITVEAAKALPPPDQVSSKLVSEDWTTRFFEECKDISDKEMQSLWARILAREVARPRSFSPKTLSVVRDLTKVEAQLFTQLCSFGWCIADSPTLVLSEIKSPFDFDTLAHLDAMGLVDFDGISGYIHEPPAVEVQASYFGLLTLLRAERRKYLGIGKVLFTLAGKQLFPICGAEPDEEHRLATIEWWKQDGWTMGDFSAPASG
jgi:hypothetical protein